MCLKQRIYAEGRWLNLFLFVFLFTLCSCGACHFCYCFRHLQNIGFNLCFYNIGYDYAKVFKQSIFVNCFEISNSTNLT